MTEPAKMLEVNDKRIETFTLLRALARISDRFLSVEQTGYEEEEWQAFVGFGNVNDREWRSVAKAGSLVDLLTVMGDKNWSHNGQS